jgi:DNA-binding MarR family transcriptional regulator
METYMLYIGLMTSPAFLAATRLLQAHDRLEQRLAGDLGAFHGLALKEALLLIHLDRAPQARLSRVDLAKRLSASPSTVTRLALPLEKRGLVGRASDPRDARLAYVTLTPSGRQLAGESRDTIARLSVKAFSDRWTEDEVLGLGDLLGRLTASEQGELT